MRRRNLTFFVLMMGCSPALAQNLDGDAYRSLDLTARLPDGTPDEIEREAASGAPVRSLAQALSRAYWTNPTLLAERSALRGVDFRVPQARAMYGPKLNFEVNYGINRNGTQTPTTPWVDNTTRSATAIAILTQPLFTFGRNAAGERLSLAQLSFQKQILRSAEQQTLLNTIVAYVGLLRDRAGVTISRDNLSILDRQFSDNRARLARREATLTDVQQVETRVELGRAQVFTAQRDAAASEANFLQAVGAPAEVLASPPELTLPVQTLEDAYAYAEGHSPIILAAQERERISRANIQAVKADLMPRIDLRGQTSYSNNSNVPTVFGNIPRQYQRDVRGEVVISGPIFESGLRQARVGEAREANDSDWRLIDQALRENRSSLAAAWSDWKAQSAAIERLEFAVAAAKSAYEGALIQEKAGLRTTLDVLDLARELLLTRSNYNASIAGVYIAQARVLAAIGALEQSWLLPDAPRYDVDEHYDKVRKKADIPLLTPILRAIDSAPLENNRQRAIRDPAAGLTAPAVVLDQVSNLPVP